MSSPRVLQEMRKTFARIGILLVILAMGFVLSSCGGGYGGGKPKNGGTTTGKGY